MFRQTMTFLAVFGIFAASRATASEVRGVYLETRTCQVYTGPCFANAEAGLTGRDAIMAWHIEDGTQQGVDISGLSVVIVLRASDTLGFQGLDNAQKLRSVILVDERASDAQHAALVEFVRTHAAPAAEDVARIDSLPISMSLDSATLTGTLEAGSEVKLETRKAVPGDCICRNEEAYYPPLAKVENFAPGVTTVGQFDGKGLGRRWSTPESRSAYMATFAYE
jgi:hypothetical protein